MNRDTHLIFEAYKQKQLELINEMDMGAERGAFIGGVASGLQKRREEYKQKKGKNPDEYIISDLVGKGEAHDKAIEKIASDVYDKLFEDGVFRARGDRKMQLDTLQNKILETLVSLGYTSTKSGWTARILRAAAESILQDIEEKEAAGDEVTQNDVHDAVEDSIEGVAKEVQANKPAAKEPAVESEPSSRYKAIVIDRVKRAGDDGVEINELIDDLGQTIQQADPDVNGKARAKGIITGLINQKVLSKYGSSVTLGEEADSEEGDDTDASDVGLDADQIAAKRFEAGREGQVRFSKGSSYWDTQH